MYVFVLGATKIPGHFPGHFQDMAFSRTCSRTWEPCIVVYSICTVKGTWQINKFLLDFGGCEFNHNLGMLPCMSQTTNDLQDRPVDSITNVELLDVLTYQP